MGCNRIMTNSTHSICIQIIMKSVTLTVSHQNREQVIGILLIWQQIRQSNQRIIDVLIIVMSHLFTVGIVFYQILQLHIQHSSLNLIQTAVTAGVLEHILLLRTIVSQSTNGSSQFGIICGNCTTITKSAKVLARVEAMACRITYRTGYPTINMLAAMSLCIIFNKLQIVLLAQSTNLIGISIASIEMYYGNSLGLGSDGCLNEVIINLQCIELRLHKNWLQAILRDGKDCGNISICGNNNLITRLHHAHFDVCAENPDESIQAIGTTNGVLCSYKLGVVCLKFLILLTLEIPASIYYTAYSLINLSSMKSSNIF